MIALRTTGIAMMAVQSVMLWMTMGYLPVSASLTAVAALGCWPRMQRAWPQQHRYWADGIVVAGFAVWWVTWLQSLEPRSDQYGTNVVMAAGFTLMGLQALRFYWRKPSGLGISFPILGALSAACAGDAYLSSTFDQRVFFWGAMAHGALVVLYCTALYQTCAPKKTSHVVYRYGVIGVCIVLSFALAAGTAFALRRSDRMVQPWMAKYMQPLQRIAPGNSETTRLGSMADFDGSEAERVVLQIFADASPGYLRGQVYADYEGSRWMALPRITRVAPADPPPADFSPALPDERAYPLYRGTPGDAHITIYPDDSIRSALFAPENTGWIGYGGEALQTNEAHVAESSDRILGRPYRAFPSPPPPPGPLTEEETARYTALPEPLAERIRALSAEVCGDRTAAPAKALAVTGYFTGNYEYSLDYEAPAHQDALERFLFAEPRPSAHCEYFASGATMLLRAAGVPARYVTGIGAWEQHPLADYWIARNRDAHAWCEAWDPKLGWFLVEATPAGGLPEAAGSEGTSAGLRDLWSMVVLQIQRTVDALRTGAWPAVAGALGGALQGLWTFITTYWVAALLLPMLTLLALVGWWKLPRLGKRRRVPRLENPLERRLAEQLVVMDRHVERTCGLARHDATTLHTFARELESDSTQDPQRGRVASWYRQWAETRYHPTPEAARVEGLAHELETLRRDQ